MNELGNEVAGEAADVASEAAVNTTSELRKRRSTRIVQAVPLQVTGVDALGRPFVERTASLILNCHGCRYQSKHYVLKNMWVKVDIPHPDSEHPPRSVRGRVAWIQRPRTVRQLFQVALELETPGNVWGIAFPPEDWIAVADAEKVRAAAAGAVGGGAHGVSQSVPQASGAAPAPTASEVPEGTIHVPVREPEGPPSGAPDNVRVFPSPASTTDASLQLARHVTRLLAEARQQIHATVREAAAQAVAAERQLNREEWEQKMVAAREALAHELAAAIDKIQVEVEARARAANEAAAMTVQDDLPKRLAPQLEEVTQNLTAKLSEEAAAQRTNTDQQLSAAVTMLHELIEQADETTTRLRAAVEQSEAQIAGRAEAAQRAMEETARQRDEVANAQTVSLTAAASEAVARLRSATEQAEAQISGRVDMAHRELEEHARQREEAANAQRESWAGGANEIQQQIASTLASARGDWQAHLAGETQAAQERWQSSVESAFTRVQERASQALNERTNELVSQLEAESGRLRETVREAAADAATETEQRIAGLRDSLQENAGRLEGAISRASEVHDKLENWSARLETVQQHALTGFQSQADDVLNLHRNELHRRSESIFEEITGRIRAAFEESAQQVAAQFTQRVESIVEPQIAKTDEAMQRLAGGRSLLDAAVTMHQERIRATSDEALAETMAEFRGNLGAVETLLRDTADTITARSLAEMETKLDVVRHQAVEDLVKSAEWYEKKAQTQIQGAAEKIGEQHAAALRERANEISGEFATEMDQSSRNFITYTQNQMAEVVRNAFDRTRSLFAEAAETTSAAFIDEIQRHARQDLEGFEAELRRSAGETRTHLNITQEELAQRVTQEQEDFLQRFQANMQGVLDAGISDANQKVQAGFEPLLKSWKSMTEAHQAEMYDIYTKLGEQAAAQYRERLDNVSNQWMLATVSSLDHQSREAVAKIAVNAEEKLRETCSKVIAEIGDSLRDRLQQIGSILNAPDKGATP
jgi:hypothetical protein